MNKREPPPWLRPRDARELSREVLQLHQMRVLEALHRLAGNETRPEEPKQ